MPYLSWNKQTISDFSAENICKMYSDGYVFTRIGKGVMNQTRSLRIDLQQFELSSENRRVLRKVENLKFELVNLPIQKDNYDWGIHKLGKDFYQEKFGENVFSASKIKTLITDSDDSNFNYLVKFTQNSAIVGYCIIYKNEEILHYAYPFYDLKNYSNNYGMGMILKLIEYAKTSNLKYFYIGSATKPADKYKMQFKGIEWFDNKIWVNDIEKLKPLIK